MKRIILSKRTIIVLLFLFAFSSLLKAQLLPVMTYGGPDDERAYALVEATDCNGYVLAGWTKSFGPGTPNFSNALIVKVDSAGIPQGAML